MINLLVADDHTLVRKGLKQILLENPDVASVDEAKDGKEVLKKISEKEYDLLLLDISLPGISGIDVLKQAKCIRQDLPILILSMYPEEQYAIRSLRAGAAGYLTKESVPDELIAAIRKVASGGRYITATLAEKLAVDVSKDSDKAVHETLSDREYQVMCMIASGFTIKKIAEKMSLSVKTVSTYRMRLLKKMNFNNNAQLIHYAIKQNLVD